MKLFIVLLYLALTLIVGTVRGQTTLTSGSDITRISVSSSGEEGDKYSGSSFVSPNGQYVAFDSTSSNLVSGDGNFEADIFLHDRLSGITSLLSNRSDGTESVYSSAISYLSPSVSSKGDVVFTAWDDLVPNDRHSSEDVYLYGRDQQLSVLSISPDGNAEGASSEASISANGRYVAFSSLSSFLVLEDTNNVRDVFVRDIATSQTNRVSVASDGTEAEADSYSGFPYMSPNGQYIIFWSSASNLVGGDDNDSEDVFIHERETGRTTRLFENSEWQAQVRGSISMSYDGQFVTFTSFANDVNHPLCQDSELLKVFVYDRATHEASCVPPLADDPSRTSNTFSSVISADGRYVAFTAEYRAPTGVQAEQVFVHARLLNETVLVSSAPDGTLGNHNSTSPSISGDGRYVVFDSEASNLVANDTNAHSDVFIRDMGPRSYALYLPVTSE